MGKFLLAATLAFAGLTTGCTKGAETAEAKGGEEKLATMSLDEVEQAVTAKSVVAVDCNHDQTRKKFGVVPGAIRVTDSDGYAASELPADKTTKLVFYCADPG